MKKNLLAALCALLLPVLAAAQFSISGKVTDQLSGETLPGASVSVLNPLSQTTTDDKGNYHIENLKAGNYTLKVSYIGYELITKAITINGKTIVDFSLVKSNFMTEEITVSGTRAASNTPTTFTNVSKHDIAKNNLGQDLPYLLEQTPSLVAQSDAGAGVGYTYIHIRGSDATRINVTINGIPYNDSEEQATFFVDIPDFASSVNNIQIQRGVGTSTNGAGAFGASINIQTTTRNDTAYTELNNSAGSYGTVKNTLNIGTGLA